MNTTDETESDASTKAYDELFNRFSDLQLDLIKVRMERDALRTERDRYYGTLAGALVSGLFDEVKAKELREPGEKLMAELAALRAKVSGLQEQGALQLAACDCAAMLDTANTHEQNKTVVRGNPAWSPAFDSVMRRTAEIIALRARVRELEQDKARLLSELKGIVESETACGCTPVCHCNDNVPALMAWKEATIEGVRAAIAAAKEGQP